MDPADQEGLEGGDAKEAGADREEGIAAIEDAEHNRCEQPEPDELGGAADGLAEGVRAGEFRAVDDGGHDGALGGARELGRGREQNRDDVVGGHAARIAQEIEADGGAGQVAEEHQHALWEDVGGGPGHDAGDGGWDNQGEHEQRTEERLAGLFIDQEDEGEVECVLGDARGEARVAEHPERPLLEQGWPGMDGGVSHRAGRAISCAIRSGGARPSRGGDT